MSQFFSPEIEQTQARLREGIGNARRMARDYGVLLRQIGQRAPAEPHRSRAKAGVVSKPG